MIAWAAEESIKLSLSQYAKQRRNPCSVYQDFSTRHDPTVKKAVVDLPIKI